MAKTTLEVICDFLQYSKLGRIYINNNVASDKETGFIVRPLNSKVREIDYYSLSLELEELIYNLNKYKGYNELTIIFHRNDENQRVSLIYEEKKTIAEITIENNSGHLTTKSLFILNERLGYLPLRNNKPIAAMTQIISKKDLEQALNAAS